MREQQVLFAKRREAERRMLELTAKYQAEIDELDKEIAGAVPTIELGSSRAFLLPVEEGAEPRWATTNLAEAAAKDVTVAHLLRMDERSAWLGLQLGDKGRVGLQLVARAKPIRLEITPTEHADVRYA